jgi:hypothetical protein
VLDDTLEAVEVRGAAESNQLHVERSPTEMCSDPLHDAAGGVIVQPPDVCGRGARGVAVQVAFEKHIKS